MRVTEIPRLALACLRELRLELDACLNLLRDDSRREGVDKHEASATELLTETLAVVAVTEGGDEDHA